jgi:hypothetical protein
MRGLILLIRIMRFLLQEPQNADADPSFDDAAPDAGGYADAAVITHTHPVVTNTTVNDSGHNHNNVLQATSDNVQRRVTLNRAVGASGTDAIGSNLGRNTDNATTGISVNVNTSISAPTGSVSGTGRNLPPYLGAYWIIKISDDGSGGGTLQAGAGIDITTAGLYSTITNTGVKSLTAGAGISISGSSGNLTITNTGSLPTLVAGQGISIAQSNTTFTITNTVTAPPVVAGPGITVINSAGGAIVSANVVDIAPGTGVNINNNNGTYTVELDPDTMGIGYSQTWQNLTSQRVPNTTYTNTTSRPIQVAITVDATGATSYLYVNNIMVGGATTVSGYSNYQQLTAIVPVGSSYRLTGVRAAWAELR